jgi:hypothetical protein
MVDMTELTIDLLKLNLENGAGHEHRVGPITERAVALFAQRAAISLESSAFHSLTFESLNGHPANLYLNSISDEQAAHQIADAWLQALVLGLKS